MRSELGRLAQALAFFTRITLPQAIWRHASPWRLDQSARWFPVAGLLIGLVPALIWAVLSHLLPPLVAAGLAIAAGIALTGALHEDGLADTADGLGGGHARERALEIMRDSTIGTYGAAALVFSIGLRWAALASLTAASGAAALIIAHSAARGSIAIALNRSSYARERGTGELVAHGVPDADLWWTLAVIAVFALVAGGWTGLVGVAFGLAAATFLHMRVDRRIGGYTGDTLGAMEQICEITVLLVLCSLWRMP